MMSSSENSAPAKYHVKVDGYVLLESEQEMRSYATTMTGSKPESNNASTSKSISIAMPLQQPTTSAASPTTPRTRTQSIQRAPPTPASPTRGRFVQIKSPEQTASDFAFGIIHLYRDVTGTEDAEITSAGKRDGTPEEENVLAILAVPSYMTAN